MLDVVGDVGGLVRAKDGTSAEAGNALGAVDFEGAMPPWPTRLANPLSVGYDPKEEWTHLSTKALMRQHP